MPNKNLSMPRKKICKIIIGSHLYGLANENSDRDYAGVYLPSADDILGLEAYPPELNESEKVSQGPRNAAGDIDCKYFSLRHFMILAAQGQSAQLEMLFAKPHHHQQNPSPEWDVLVSHRHIFLSKSTFTPFVRFALSQATKATMKGENLRFVRELIQWISGLDNGVTHKQIREFVEERDGECFLGSVKVDVSQNQFGAKLLTLAHRQYDVGASLKRLLESLKVLESKYGSRSKAAAESGIDHKSLSHAYRMLFEAEEMLTSGALSLPLRDPQRDFLRSIKEKRMPVGLDWEKDIIERINRLEHTVAPNSGLPEEPDWDAIEALHQKLLRNQLYEAE
jgi:hypothetical protein